MAAALHLLTTAEPAMALATIARQLEAGDRVQVVLLSGAAAPALPAGVTVHRVPGDLSYEALLGAIYAADTVVAW
jgi:hypothetical protein